MRVCLYFVLHQTQIGWDLNDFNLLKDVLGILITGTILLYCLLAILHFHLQRDSFALFR